MDGRMERNKRVVTAFYDLMFNQCKPRQAVEMYAGGEYIQHNPEVANCGLVCSATLTALAR